MSQKLQKFRAGKGLLKPLLLGPVGKLKLTGEGMTQNSQQVSDWWRPRPSCPPDPSGPGLSLVVVQLLSRVRLHGLQSARLLCPWNFQARILERLTVSFSRGSSRPRYQTRVSCIIGGFCTDRATRQVSAWGLAFTCQGTLF